VIVWGTTEPTVRPTGDEYLLPTFGFVVGPNATLRLPDNRVWESAAVYSADCTLLDQVFADGAIRVIIDGAEVSVAASGSIGAYQVAKTTETCRLVPYEGPTVPPL
jgi:hypothetical protein